MKVYELERVRTYIKVPNVGYSKHPNSVLSSVSPELKTVAPGEEGRVLKFKTKTLAGGL